MVFFISLTSILGGLLPMTKVVAESDYRMGTSFPDVYHEQMQVPMFVGRVEGEAMFQYFSHTVLPMCDFFGVSLDKLTNIEPTMGSRLTGQSWAFDPRLPIVFNNDIENSPVCKLSMTSDFVREAMQQVQQGTRVSYWVDGLPSVAHIGLERQGIHYIYKHRHFDIVTDNLHSIVAFDVTPSVPVQIVLNSRLELTYSVKFTKANELENSGFNNTVDTRYERYLTLSSTEAEQKSYLDRTNVIDAIGFTSIMTCFSGLIFQSFCSGNKIDEDDSPWSVTANLPRLAMLRNQVYRRPIHTSIISVFVALGAQTIQAAVAFALYITIMVDKSDLIFGQLDGRILDPLIGCLLGSSFVGGLAGGNFIKAWGIRRFGIAYLAQIGLPFLVFAILFIQYRTVAIMVGSSLAWSLLDCFVLLGYAAVNAVGHFIGFTIGFTMSNILEFNSPVDSKDIVEVAKAPGEGRASRAVILCVPPFLATAVGCGPLYYSLQCTMRSFCVQENISYLFGTVLCTLLLLASSMTIMAYLLLCLGDGRWQWNAARTGILHGLFQSVIFTIWTLRSNVHSFGIFSKTYAFGVIGLVGILTSCASTMTCYYASSAILLTIYSSEKSE